MDEKKPEFLTTPDEVKVVLQDLLELYKDRNDLIKRIRDHASGKNPIEVPSDKKFVVKPLRRFLFRSAVEEKHSRFLHRPEYQVTPRGIGHTPRRKAEKLEKAMEAALYWMTRDTNAWAQMLMDVVTCEGGVLKWERIPADTWPLLIQDSEKKDHFDREYPDEKARNAAREKYKKSQGWPITMSYVPLESFFADYRADGTFGRCFQLQRRSLNEILDSPVFSDTGKAQLRSFADAGSRGASKTLVTIVHYCDERFYSYWALTPPSNRRSSPSPKASSFWPQATSAGTTGEPILLHYYEHGLGVPIFTPISGAHGGWRQPDNEILTGRIEAMLQLAQAADELSSQGFTNLRETFWPTLIIEYLKDREDPSAGKNRNQVKRKPGEDIHLYEGETIRPLFEAKDNPLYESQMKMIERSFDLIAGSTATRGEHQAGVDTGYHEQLLVTLAQRLDAMVEAGLVQGAIAGMYMMFRHIIFMNETVYAEASVKGKSGRYADTLSIKPEDLDPLPRLDCRVRAQRTIDLSQALNDAHKALSDTSGPGTRLMARSSVRERFLAIEDPEEEELKIRIENEKQAAYEGGVVTNRIGELLGLMLVTQSQPDVSEEALNGGLADPGFANQAKGFMNGMTPTPPIAEGSSVPSQTQGGGGGLPVGSAQPAQVAGVNANATMGGGQMVEPQMAPPQVM